MRYYRTSCANQEGKISLNGVTGYMIVPTTNSVNKDQFYLIYSTGMQSLYYDLTPEWAAKLDEHFKY